MAEFVLCVDAGNSRIKFGLFRRTTGPQPEPSLPECLATVMVAHGQILPWQKLREQLPVPTGAVIKGFVAGSNPDGISAVLQSWPTEWIVPVVIDDVLLFPIQVRLEAPSKAGVDRILNAVACNRIRPAGCPAVIVDTGTATTVDAIACDGAFEGGAILPGLELCARALNQYTALLPYVTIDELSEESHEPLGCSTREALRSGILWGQVGAIKELIERLGRRWDAPPFIILTGGGAPLIAQYLAQADWQPCLALQGLALVVEHLGKARA